MAKAGNRNVLFGVGWENSPRAGLSREAVAKVWAAGGKLSLAQLLRCRVLSQRWPATGREPASATAHRNPGVGKGARWRSATSRTVNHGWLMKFLRHRTGDERLLRMIGRMLKAGILEDGLVGGKAANSGFLRRAIPSNAPDPAIALTFDLQAEIVSASYLDLSSEPDFVVEQNSGLLENGVTVLAWTGGTASWNGRSPTTSASSPSPSRSRFPKLSRTRG